MTKYILAIIFGGIVTTSPAQPTYTGAFSPTETFIGTQTELPVGTHKAWYADGKPFYKVSYGENGRMLKIAVKGAHGTVKQKFPKKLERMEWVEIKPGLWINQTDQPFSPKTEFYPERPVNVHYAGYLLDGSPFDNSFARRASLEGKLGSFVEGFALGVANIRPGELRVLKIAPEMGYGNEEAANIPAGSTLLYIVYRIE